MNTITKFPKESTEYRKLQNFTELLNDEVYKKGLKATFYIRNTYFDFGQNWTWTTICVDYIKNEEKSTYQALSPRQHEMILTDLSLGYVKNEVIEHLEKILNR